MVWINRKWKAESVKNCVKKEASYIKICRWVSVNGVMLPLFVRDAFGIRSGYVQFRPIPMLKWGVLPCLGFFLVEFCSGFCASYFCETLQITDNVRFRMWSFRRFSVSVTPLVVSNFCLIIYNLFIIN